MADKIWHLLFNILDNFHALLFHLQLLLKQSGWLYSNLTMPLLLLLLLLALPFILPKGMLSRLIALAPLSLIGILVYVDTNGQNSPVEITSLNPRLSTSSTTFSAALIEQEKQAWLLISAYPKGNDKAFNLSAQQVQQLSHTLYDHLKQHKHQALTGVIVQTVNPELAAVVATLRGLLPISYYWQAGLPANRLQVNRLLAGADITAENCQVGKQWQSPPSVDTANTALSSMQLVAITGWSHIDDPLVWDCSIQLSTTDTVRVIQHAQPTKLLLNNKQINKIEYGGRLDDKLNNSARDTKNSGRDSIQIKDAVQLDKNLNDNIKTNDVILFSSASSQLSGLWKLMCSDTSAINNHHLLSSSQAYVDKELVHSLQSRTWHILDEKLIPATTNLKEAHLFWEQHYRSE